LGLILTLLFIGSVFVIAGLVAGSIIGGLVGGLMAFITPVLTVIFAFLAIIAGVVLGFWLLMRFSVAIPVFLLEGRGVVDSLARSGFLTKGHRWRLLVSMLVIGLVVYVIYFLFNLPFGISSIFQSARGIVPLSLRVGSSVATAVSLSLVGSLFAIAIALIYYDVRIRKEAFDLEAMMAALGQPAVAPAPPTAPLPPQQAL
jgi:hypothetical protein